jgi:hypothetical protein
MTDTDAFPYYRLADQDPQRAMDLFLDAIQSMDVDRCLFPMETVRVKLFRKLGRISEFRPWLERWKFLLLQALERPPYSRSMKHHRLLFAMALHLNDRALADQVSPEYLRGFDLDTAFPQPSPSVPAASRPTINLDAPPRNSVDGRARVLIHVDGESDYPIAVYVHHYAMTTRERADKLLILLDWLRDHANKLQFDSLENYYGEWHSRIVPAQT